MNAARTFVPPMMIFPRKNMKPELKYGAQPDAVSASGRIQHIFTQWFKHFLSCVKPTEDDLAVLVLDGHYSHTKNTHVIDMARNNHVSLICLPPHSTHKMQPLDVAFIRSFKIYYTQEYCWKTILDVW